MLQADIACPEVPDLFTRDRRQEIWMLRCRSC